MDLTNVRYFTGNEVHVHVDLEGQISLITDDGKSYCLPHPEKLVSVLEGRLRHAETHSHHIEIQKLDHTVNHKFEHTHYFEEDHDHKIPNIPPKKIQEAS